MTRIRLPDPAEMTSEQRLQYNRFPSNLARALVCAAPELASRVLDLGAAFRRSALDPKIREMVILRVAGLSDSAYERMQHHNAAREAGWTDDEIAAISSSDASTFNEPFAAVLQLTDQCCRWHRTSDPTFSTLSALLSDQEIATVILLIGQYVLTAIFVNALDLELDDNPTSWGCLAGDQR